MNVWIWVAIGAAALCGVLLAALRNRQGGAASERARKHKLESLDTVQAWEPHGTRVLSAEERDAYAVLVRALPEYMVLAQVPLSRFLKVPTRYSYAEWLKRVGSLSADLVVCDRSSAVVAVVEVRAARESDRSRQRFERMARVLEAAHIRLLVWQAGQLPAPAAVREMLLPEEAQEWSDTRNLAMSRPFGATPLSALPVAEVDDSGPGGLHEPPPSTWFDDFEQQPAASAPPRRP